MQTILTVGFTMPVSSTNGDSPPLGQRAWITAVFIILDGERPDPGLVPSGVAMYHDAIDGLIERKESS